LNGINFEMTRKVVQLGENETLQIFQGKMERRNSTRSDSQKDVFSVFYCWDNV